MANRVRIIQPWTVDVQPAWTVAGVRSALESHEWGTFTDSAKLWSAMGRDDRLVATLNTRIDGVLGASCKLVPHESDDAAAQRIADELDAEWPTIATRDQLRALIGWRLGIGAALGRLVEKREASRWRYCLDVWDPQFLSFDDYSKTWTVTTQEGDLTVEPGVDGWVLWTGGPRGWMDGLVRSLAIPYLVRSFAWRDWARYSERHGMPILIGAVPAVADDGDKAQFFSDLRDLGAETTITTPQGVGPSGESYDVKLLEATANTWEGFERLITACNVSYAVTILGQNLTTEVQGGSYAAAKVADDVRSDVKRADAEGLYDIGRTQILPLTVAANYGAEAPVPGPSYDVEPPENLTEKATQAKGLADAIAAFNTAGYEIKNLPALAEQFGVELEEAEEPEPAPVPPQFLPPSAAPQPDQDKPAEESQAEGDSEPDGDDDDEAKLHERDHPHTSTVELASGDSPADAPGFVAGQLWIDELGDDGIKRAAAAFSPDLAAVKAIIDGSDSFDEVRSKLHKLYREALPPAALTRLLEKAIILGDLAGRWSVTEDL